MAGRFWPRLREAGVGGASGPSPPTAAPRLAPHRRLSQKTSIASSPSSARAPGEVALCKDARDYRAARAAGRHAAFIGVQGGNAFDGDLALESFDASLLLKVTLVHLSTSSLGTTSARRCARPPMAAA